MSFRDYFENVCNNTLVEHLVCRRLRPTVSAMSTRLLPEILHGEGVSGTASYAIFSISRNILFTVHSEPSESGRAPAVQAPLP